MEIKDFEVEQWMNLWETKCTHNVAETCVYSLSLDQLFELTGGDKQAFLDAFAARRLTYGDIEGRPDLLSGIAKLYRTVAPRTSRSSTRRAPRCLTLPVPRSPWTLPRGADSAPWQSSRRYSQVV